jgi:hypothetical protein
LAARAVGIASEIPEGSEGDAERDGMARIIGKRSPHLTFHDAINGIVNAFIMLKRASQPKPIRLVQLEFVTQFAVLLGSRVEVP